MVGSDCLKKGALGSVWLPSHESSYSHSLPAPSYGAAMGLEVIVIIMAMHEEEVSNAWRGLIPHRSRLPTQLCKGKC